MSAEADLMLVLLGLQMNSFTKEQVVECGAILAQDRTRSLADILEKKGYLRKTTRRALEALVADQVEQAGGDPALSLASLPVDPDVQKSLLALPLDDEVKGTLVELKARPPSDAVETVVMTRSERERYQPGAEMYSSSWTERRPKTASHGLRGQK